MTQSSTKRLRGLPQQTRRTPSESEFASPRERRLHRTFEVGITLKGINAALEIAGGLLFVLVKPESLNHLIVSLTENELSRNPDDWFSNHLVRLGEHFTPDTRHFGAWYLLSHGIVKIFLVVGLLKRKMWAYKATIVFLVLFILYQVYRMILQYTGAMMALTLLDVALVGLTLWEYGHRKRFLAGAGS